MVSVSPKSNALWALSHAFNLTFKSLMVIYGHCQLVTRQKSAIVSNRSFRTRTTNLVKEEQPATVLVVNCTVHFGLKIPQLV